jgi:hypothetical protein
MAAAQYINILKKLYGWPFIAIESSCQPINVPPEGTGAFKSNTG